MSEKFQFDPGLFDPELLEALHRKAPPEDPIDSKHFYLAAEDLQEGRREDFAQRLGYIAQGYEGDIPETFAYLFRKLAAAGGLDFDQIEREALRPRTLEESLSDLAKLVEPLPDGSHIKRLAEDIQVTAIFNPNVFPLGRK